MFSFCFSFPVLNVNINNCVNIIKKNGLIHCAGQKCGILVGICNNFEDKEIITFINVREVLFRPHTSYTCHRTSIDEKFRRVLFTETVEYGERCSNEVLNVPNILIFPLKQSTTESAVDPDKPSTSTENKNPVIRVAAFASETSININENRVIQFFKNAILHDVERNKLGPMTTLSLVSDENLRKQLSTAFSSGSLQQANFDSVEIEPEFEASKSKDHIEEFGLSEFLAPKSVIENSIDCSDINLNFFDTE